MKTLFLTPLVAALLLTHAGAQAPSTTGAVATTPPTPSATAMSRDGFMMQGKSVMMMRNGASTKVDREMTLPGGTRIDENGMVTQRDGTSAVLKSNQMLSMDGMVRNMDAVANPNATAAAGDGSATPKSDVGISSRDGITISGAEVFVTRNGVTEKLAADLKLKGGVSIKADGTIMTPDGTKVTMRPNQILDFEGKLHDAPVRPNPASGDSNLSNPAR